MKKLFIFILSLNVYFASADNILTPYGYIDINDAHVGDTVIGFDLLTGNTEYNVIEEIEPLDKEWFNNIGDSSFTWYLVNGSYKMFKYQSVFNHAGICIHAFELQIGDTIYDYLGGEIIVENIEETIPDSIWYRLIISGNHSFISGNILYHNASRFWVTGGVDNNWGTTGNWSAISGGGGGSSVPTSADDVTFDKNGNSNCTLNTSARSAKTLTVVTGGSGVGYTSTITFTQSLTVSGSITLGSNMGFSGSSALTINATGTLTSNGKIISVPFTITGAITITLADNAITSSTLTINGASTINGNTLNIGADLATGSANNISGTTNFKFTGTGNWNSATTGIIFNPIEFAMGSGTLTLGSAKWSGTGTITYTSGTISGSGSLTIGGAGTLSLTGATIPNVIISVAGTVTNSGNFTVSTLLTLANASVALVLNGSTITCASLTTNPAGSGTVTGTTEIIVNGASGILTYSGSGTNQYRLNTTINSSGSVSISGTFKYGSGTFKLQSNMSGTGILAINSSCNIDGNGYTLPKLNMATAGVTLTLNSNLALSSDFTSTTATAASPVSIVSNSGGTQRKLTLSQGATQDIGFTNATDINSADGQTIWDWKGTLSNTTNWNLLTVNRTMGYTF